MPRRHLAIAVLPVALLLSAPLAAQQVYQWTDAQGVSHYSSSPPASGDYRTRDLATRDPAAPATPEAEEKPVCRTARENIALIDGAAPLQVDTDGDGEPDKTLTDAERTDRRNLAVAALKVECGDAAPPAEASGT